MVAHRSPEVPPRPATAADLDALPDHVVGEILDGELVVTPRPAPAHAVAASGLGAMLWQPFHRKSGGGPDSPGGWWILDEPELRIGQPIVVPDVAGWRRERMPHRPKTAWFDVVPDWVCEVMSPGTALRDRTQKARIYAEMGVQWLWLMDPLNRTVEVMQRDGDRWNLAGVWGGNDPEARMPPFDAVSLDLARWWEDGEEEPEVAPPEP